MIVSKKHCSSVHVSNLRRFHQPYKGEARTPKSSTHEIALIPLHFTRTFTYFIISKPNFPRRKLDNAMRRDSFHTAILKYKVTEMFAALRQVDQVGQLHEDCQKRVSESHDIMAATHILPLIASRIYLNATT
jgi:hypothetical protein